MKEHDVCNGDADGLTALHQWRLAHPAAAELVTGVKRDIALVRRVQASAGDRVHVFDHSLAVNAEAVCALLSRDVHVLYVDHHAGGPLPPHPCLALHLDTAADVCTGVIVDRLLGGRHRAWAIVAAFGDNLHATAHGLADTIGLGADARAALAALGQALTYNAYADDAADALVHPAALYAELAPFTDPLAFVRDAPVARVLAAARADDLAQARRLRAALENAHAALYLLPDAPWSRRVRGPFAHELACAAPERAHAVLSPRADGAYTVSVRAPLARPRGADQLCAAFAGGGRSAAAGIGELPPAHVPALFERLAAHYAS